MIEIKNLNKYYGDHHVVKNARMVFEKGCVYGLVGENGAGKTTLFKCVAGLEKHDGEIITDYGHLKDHLGYLPTEPYFFQKITGMEYIRLLCNARRIKAENIHEKNIFDLPLNQYASTYSTGMKKKLALLAILMQENEVFILDEPFNGVDIQSNILIADIILRMKELGKTVIISSHIFSTLSETCDEIFLMKEGAIIRRVLKADFPALEYEMKQILVGDRIEKLGLK